MIMGRLHSQVSGSTILLNQVGFFPGGQKVAVIRSADATEFLVRSVNTGQVVLKAKLSEPRKSVFSGSLTRIADFSDVTAPGKYVISVPEVGDSYEFEIKKAVFDELTASLIKGYYFQRMSTDLPPEFAGKWSRKGGHPDRQVIIHPAAASSGRPAGTVISSPRGWYDAGDYNKYIVNSGITMGTLLSAYEEFPEYYSALRIKIPESGNGAPDLLNESVWNLRWMLTMQDPGDGGVYNKVTNANFDGMVMPVECNTPRYVVPKGTAATLDFAAVMAQAARVFKGFAKVYPGLSDSCLASAQKAWTWAKKNPNVPYDQNLMNKNYQPVIVTGGYGDNNFTDEFIWAASELYVTTGKNEYYSAQNMIPDDQMTLPSWNNVKLLGYYTLARFEKNLSGTAKKDITAIKQMLLNSADKLAEGIGTSAYQTVMGRSAADFVWGSNSVAANEGVLLIEAYRISGNKKYLGLALGNLDYLLGRNATGYSFVTGYGHKSPMFPHHRLSEADGIADPIPGLLVGGPNPGQQDGCKTYPSSLPDESYTDTVCSYASNEIAINWNAPAVYLAGALDALYVK